MVQLQGEQHPSPASAQATVHGQRTQELQLGTFKYSRGSSRIGYTYEEGGRVLHISGIDHRGSYIAPSRSLTRHQGGPLPQVRDPLNVPEAEIVTALALTKKTGEGFSGQGLKRLYSPREHWTIRWLDLKEADGNPKEFTRPGFQGTYRLHTDTRTGRVSVVYSGGSAVMLRGSSAVLVRLPPQVYHRGVWDLDPTVRRNLQNHSTEPFQSSAALPAVKRQKPTPVNRTLVLPPVRGPNKPVPTERGTEKKGTQRITPPKVELEPIPPLSHLDGSSRRSTSFDVFRLPPRPAAEEAEIAHDSYREWLKRRQKEKDSFGPAEDGSRAIAANERSEGGSSGSKG